MRKIFVLLLGLLVAIPAVSAGGNSLPGSFGAEVVSKQTVNVQVCSEAQ